MASQIELIVRARDQASKTLQQIGQGLRNQSQSYRQLGQSHTQYANQTSRYARQQLSYGQATLRQTVQQRSEVQRLGQTYQRMGSQATQSAQQQARATKEARQQQVALGREIRQNNGQYTRMQKMGAGMHTAGAVVGGVTAAGYVAAQPIGRVMEYDRSLRHVANTVYDGKSNEEKQAGLGVINKRVIDAANSGGVAKEAALQTLNSMAASGTMNMQDAMDMLPHVTKTAMAAGDADPNDIGMIFPGHWTVCWNHDYFKAVDFPEFIFFRLCRTGHACDFVVEAEVVLEGDCCQRLVFLLDRDAFFSLDCLVQTVAVASAVHEPACELVDYYYFIIFYDVVYVVFEQVVSFQ